MKFHFKSDNTEACLEAKETKKIIAIATIT
jgi:hypothetical protein